MTDTHGLRKLHADTVPVKWASAAGVIWALLPEILDEVDQLREAVRRLEGTIIELKVDLRAARSVAMIAARKSKVSDNG